MENATRTYPTRQQCKAVDRLNAQLTRSETHAAFVALYHQALNSQPEN